MPETDRSQPADDAPTSKSPGTRQVWAAQTAQTVDALPGRQAVAIRLIYGPERLTQAQVAARLRTNVRDIGKLVAAALRSIGAYQGE